MANSSEPIEKNVNSSDLPCSSEYLNLWGEEKIDWSILSHYYEIKGPSIPLQNKPQTKIFNINFEPSRHFTFCRGSYLSFDIRQVRLPNHDKLPPIHPPPKLSNDTTNERSERRETIDQSETRPQEYAGNTYVLDRQLPNGQERQERHERQERQERHERQERQERHEMEKRKKRERMEKWIGEQYRRKRLKSEQDNDPSPSAKRRKMLPSDAEENEGNSSEIGNLWERGRKRGRDKESMMEEPRIKKSRKTECNERSPSNLEATSDLSGNCNKRLTDEGQTVTDDPIPFKGSNFENAIGKSERV